MTGVQTCALPIFLLQREVEVAGLQSEIRQKVEERVQERQREFFLREQLKEIQQQLGISKDDKTVEVERFRERQLGAEKTQVLFRRKKSPAFRRGGGFLGNFPALPFGVGRVICFYISPPFRVCSVAVLVALASCPCLDTSI